MPPSTPPSAHWFEAVPAFSAPRESFPPRGARRSLRLLSRWIGTLVKPAPAERDLHLVFCDGSTLCALIERLRPATKLVRFRKALTRGLPASVLEVFVFAADAGDRSRAEAMAAAVAAMLVYERERLGRVGSARSFRK